MHMHKHDVEITNRFRSKLSTIFSSSKQFQKSFISYHVNNCVALSYSRYQFAVVIPLNGFTSQSIDFAYYLERTSQFYVREVAGWQNSDLRLTCRKAHWWRNIFTFDNVDATIFSFP